MCSAHGMGHRMGYGEMEEGKGVAEGGDMGVHECGDVRRSRGFAR